MSPIPIAEQLTEVKRELAMRRQDESESPFIRCVMCGEDWESNAHQCHAKRLARLRTVLSWIERNAASARPELIRKVCREALDT